MPPSALAHGKRIGSALHVMLFLENTLQALFIFNGLRRHHGQRALLGYHYLYLDAYRSLYMRFPGDR